MTSSKIQLGNVTLIALTGVAKDLPAHVGALKESCKGISFRDVNGKIQRVGNSVGLRSKKLLDLPKKLNLEWKSFHGYFNEDGAISVNYRHIFEANGCKYMPFEEAI